MPEPVTGPVRPTAVIPQRRVAALVVAAWLLGGCGAAGPADVVAQASPDSTPAETAGCRPVGPERLTRNAFGEVVHSWDYAGSTMQQVDPPAGADLTKVGDEALERYGLPPRPKATGDEVADDRALAVWRNLVLGERVPLEPCAAVGLSTGLAEAVPQRSPQPMLEVTVPLDAADLTASVPTDWTFRTGRINMHYIQVYDVLSSTPLPPPCEYPGPGQVSCGVRLEGLAQGDVALEIRSNSGLPRATPTIELSKGQALEIAGREATGYECDPYGPAELSARCVDVRLTPQSFVSLAFVWRGPRPDMADTIEDVIASVRIDEHRG